MKTLKERYEKALGNRQTILDKARKASKLTIPSLIPDENSKNQNFYEPNQSIGSNGINYLASKIAMTMLPPNSPFFRYIGDSIKLKQEAELEGIDPIELESEFNKNLSLLAEYVKDSIEESNDRVTVGEALKHVITCGNCLLVDDKDKNLKYYPLSRYIVKRDYHGNVLYIITKETIGFQVLPEEIQEKIRNKHVEEKEIEVKEFDLFTVFERKRKNKNSKYFWNVYQECEEIIIDSTKGQYPIEKAPFMALRWNAINGEDYGRGLIEEVVGDLKALDDISKAITEGAKASARIITLVNPAGMTRLKALHNARNGEIIPGRKDDVSFLQSEKYHDLATAQRREQDLEKRLAKIFLTADSVTRDAERVTATEIQYLVQKLEEAFGNTYSLLLQSFQRPYLEIKYHHLRMKNRSLPNIDKVKGNGIKLVITTGIDALGRNNEALKKDIFFAKIAQLAQIPQVNIDIVAQSYANDLGLDIEGFFKSQQQQQEELENTQVNETMKTATPELIRQGGAILQQQNQENQQEENRS